MTIHSAVISLNEYRSTTFVYISRKYDTFVVYLFDKILQDQPAYKKHYYLGLRLKTSSRATA